MNHDTCFRKSRICYFLAGVVFVLWFVAAAVGQERPQPVREALREFLVNRIIPTRIVDVEDGNPAPSVELEVLSAPWCGPCRRIKPVLDDLKRKGYSIKVVTKDSPGKSVPHFTWKHHGEVEREHTGVKGYPDKELVRRTLVETFAEIEGTVFGTEIETP